MIRKTLCAYPKIKISEPEIIGTDMAKIHENQDVFYALILILLLYFHIFHPKNIISLFDPL
jgi:hypothetical protein